MWASRRARCYPLTHAYSHIHTHTFHTHPSAHTPPSSTPLSSSFVLSPLPLSLKTVLDLPRAQIYVAPRTMECCSPSDFDRDRERRRVIQLTLSAKNFHAKVRRGVCDVWCAVWSVLCAARCVWCVVCSVVCSLCGAVCVVCDVRRVVCVAECSVQPFTPQHTNAVIGIGGATCRFNGGAPRPHGARSDGPTRRGTSTLHITIEGRTVTLTVGVAIAIVTIATCFPPFLRS